LTISVVLADANILYSRTLRDYFLYAADEGALEIHWSQQILDEMSRNLRDKLGLSEADTTRLELLMNEYIEYALIDVVPTTWPPWRGSRWTPRTAMCSRQRSPLTRTSSSRRTPGTFHEGGWPTTTSSC